MNVMFILSYSHAARSNFELSTHPLKYSKFDRKLSTIDPLGYLEVPFGVSRGTMKVSRSTPWGVSRYDEGISKYPLGCLAVR